MYPRARRSLTVALAVVALLAGGNPIRGQGDPPASDALTLRIFVATTAEAAEKVAARLAAGESFVELARTESTAPNADRGGWLGRQRLADLRPEIRAAVAGLRPGQISPVVRIPTGFAIFRVEPDESAVEAEPTSESADVRPTDRYAALASSGAVKYVMDVSGISEERSGFEPSSLPAGWDIDSTVLCDARTSHRAESREAVEAFLAGDSRDAIASADPLDVVQLYFGLGQLYAYDGRMAEAIVAFEKGRAFAQARMPAALGQLDEALGVASLHKAVIDNGIVEHPGEWCLLGPDPVAPFAVQADVAKAIEHFETYLARTPDDLEVRWLLNLAYRASGGYPDRVPAAYLVPPSALGSPAVAGRFRDVAVAAGLVNVEAAGGLVVEDFDGDGHLDVLTSTTDNCGAMRLLHNNGDGTFSDRSAASGVSTQLGGLNLVRGDYDNDGCPDVLLLRGAWENLPQRMSLLRNGCDGTFTDVTVASGLGAPMGTQTAVFTDVDNDGWLDLFVGNETGPAALFHNRRDGTFENVAAAAGVARSTFAKGVAAIDYDNDRYPDLFVSNFGQRNLLYHNNGDGTFTEVASAARVLGTPAGFATWFFDYDNDDFPDLFVASYVTSAVETVLGLLRRPLNGTTTKLYRNLGDGSFRDVTAETGLDRVLMPMGANFGDLDNDGFLDVYLGTGHPSYAALVPNVLLRNDEGRRFVDVSTSSGTAELHKGHGVAFADLDNDGDQEIVHEVGGAVPGDRHQMRVFENPGHGNDWLAVRLVGTRSNRIGVGARIRLTVRNDGGPPRTIVRTAGNTGSFGVSPLTTQIGLGRDATIERLEIWWPASDTRQQFTNVQANSSLRIEEGADRYETITRPAVTLGRDEWAP